MIQYNHSTNSLTEAVRYYLTHCRDEAERLDLPSVKCLLGELQRRYSNIKTNYRSVYNTLKRLSK